MFEYQKLFPVSILCAVSGLPESLHHGLVLLGRTHVIAIHFPIALLLMAALGEIWGRVQGRPAGWTTATLMCGAVGAAISMALGWTLIWFSHNEPGATLTLHQYLGTATAIVALVTAAFHWKVGRERARWWMSGLILITAAMVGLTGHLGGTLVHGNLFAR